MKKIVLIAGEPSGDAIGAKIMQHLENCELSGVGGNKMIALSFKSIFDISEISIMGFVEIIKSIRKIIRRINQTVEYINNLKPDVVVTIDSPGFVKRVVKKLRKIGYSGRIIHIVAPSVWAYREGRAKTFAKYFDEICCLLPFEPKYFEKYGMKAHFVGNISIEDDLITLANQYNNNINQTKKDQRNIAITLGSRMVEIEKNLPILSQVMNNLSQKYKDIQYFIPTIPYLEQTIEQYLKQHNKNCKFFINSENNAIQWAVENSSIAITKSGTNTMQFLVKSIPIVVYYKIHPISCLIIKTMIKIKFANLVNIIANKMIIPELIQNMATVENIHNEAEKLLSQQQFDFTQIHQCLLQMLPGDMKLPSKRIAEIVMLQQD